jgi:hypothetical protein
MKQKGRSKDRPFLFVSPSAKTKLRERLDVLVVNFACGLARVGGQMGQ